MTRVWSVEELTELLTFRNLASHQLSQKLLQAMAAGCVQPMLSLVITNLCQAKDKTVLTTAPAQARILAEKLILNDPDVPLIDAEEIKTFALQALKASGIDTDDEVARVQASESLQAKLEANPVDWNEAYQGTWRWIDCVEELATERGISYQQLFGDPATCDELARRSSSPEDFTKTAMATMDLMDPAKVIEQIVKPMGQQLGIDAEEMEAVAQMFSAELSAARAAAGRVLAAEIDRIWGN